MLVGAVAASGRSPRINERFALRSIRLIHSAQMTYAAVFGNGNYGSLDAMAKQQLIDSVLGAGNKYGYVFVVTTSFATTTTPGNFTVRASPVVYRKTGRSSFYIDAAGDIHAADKGGANATVSDPIIDDCTTGTAVENETCNIITIRTLHGSEMTYAATSGFGNYGSLAELAAVSLIVPALGSGQLRSYAYSVVTTAATTQQYARFHISAKPLQYGITGFRSLFIDESGVIHAADKHGAPADENDPVL